MTRDQLSKLRRLRGCTFVPAGFDKRFVRDMSSRPDDYEPTPRQAVQIERLWWRYRGQLGHDDPRPDLAALLAQLEGARRGPASLPGP